MNSILFPREIMLFLCVISAASCCPTNNMRAKNRSIDVDEFGHAGAVVVDDKALAHTTQLLPYDESGEITAEDLEKQTAQLLANLTAALEAVGSSTAEIARLNIYVASNELVEQVRKLLADSLLDDVQPALTYVVSQLPDERALVAADAIAAVPAYKASKILRANDSELAQIHKTTLASVLPRGRVVYISGMAERTDDLAAATTGTMKQLHGVLELLGLDATHVVHVKAFMKPIGDVAVARQAIQTMYSEGMSPPMTFVEWTNSLPIEIEMIAHLPGEVEAAPTVEHRWQPGEKRSPVYCRFAVVDAPIRIYVKGLKSRTDIAAANQVRDIFRQLEQTLKQADSDLRHLVKATYYVADDEVSKALNEVRPEFYDPEHPPAASKASIASTGDAKRTVTVDLIAVPAQ